MCPSNCVKVDADALQTAMLLLFCQTRDGGLVLVLSRVWHGGQGRGVDGYNLTFAPHTKGFSIKCVKDEVSTNLVWMSILAASFWMKISFLMICLSVKFSEEANTPEMATSTKATSMCVDCLPSSPIMVTMVSNSSVLYTAAKSD